MKLTEAMGQKFGSKQSVASEGGPCPFCHGERAITVYLQVTIRARQVGDRTQTRKGFVIARPGFWQGACLECAAGIQDDLALRAERYDYLQKVNGVEGT